MSVFFCTYCSTVIGGNGAFSRRQKNLFSNYVSVFSISHNKLCVVRFCINKEAERLSPPPPFIRPCPTLKRFF